MASEILSSLEQSMISALHGLTMMFIGSLLFTAKDGAFVFRGRFRGKEEAVVILLGAVLFTAIVNPLVEKFWIGFVEAVSMTSIGGLVLVVAMWTVNDQAGWRHLEEKSIAFYLLGCALIFLPHL